MKESDSKRRVQARVCEGAGVEGSRQVWGRYGGRNVRERRLRNCERGWNGPRGVDRGTVAAVGCGHLRAAVCRIVSGAVRLGRFSVSCKARRFAPRPHWRGGGHQDREECDRDSLHTPSIARPRFARVAAVQVAAVNTRRGRV